MLHLGLAILASQQCNGPGLCCVFCANEFLTCSGKLLGIMCTKCATLSSHALKLMFALTMTIPRHHQRRVQCPRCSPQSAAYPALDCSCDAHPNMIKRKSVQICIVASASASKIQQRTNIAKRTPSNCVAVRKMELRKVHRKSEKHTLLAVYSHVACSSEIAHPAAGFLDGLRFSWQCRWHCAHT